MYKISTMRRAMEKKERIDESHLPEEQSLLYSKKGMEILNMLKRGTEFTHELLKENEKLRFVAARFEEQCDSLKTKIQETASKTELENLNRKLKSVEEEKAKLLVRFNEVEKENVDFANKYIEIEQENEMMANLYIASYQLHSTLDFNEVLRIVMEIIINLIGAEQFSLLMLDEKTHEIKSVACEGVENEDIPSVKVGEGVIGNVVKSGESFYSESMDAPAALDPLSPIVCIPLKIKERVIGAISIYKMFRQKEGFTKLDYELFYMLGGHAATAIFSSKLYTESERRLSTIQGFIDLITK